jgi:malonyl-CoA/methylmalonyl-CoA synthetase
MSQNLVDLFRARSPEPAKTLIETPEGRVITYAEAYETAAGFMATLAGLGVKPDDRVMVKVDKSPEASILYLSVLAMGAVFVPLNPDYTIAELDYFIGDAEPRVIVCRPEEATEVSNLTGRHGVSSCLTLGTDGSGSFLAMAKSASGEFSVVPREKDGLAAILYTSGTTGRSKGAMLTHGNLASNALGLVETWKFTSNDVLLHALPIFHSHGLFVGTNVTLMSGASMIFLPKFDADAIIAALPRATTMMGVPTFYTRLLKDPRFTRDLVSHMRLFVSGSAPLLAETHREFEARTGHKILERYGMTETNMNTSNPYDGDRVPGSVGLPLPGVEVRIVDPDDGKALPQGEVGMVELKGPNVFKGYWRNPEKTDESFRQDGFFITGDLGHIDERGYLNLSGREKDLIISGGFNVYPTEVETEIDALPGVVESAVVGVTHPDFGEGVTAVVVADGTLDEKGVIAALGTRLAKYKIPKRVVTVPELPRNTMGKVQKNLLRERYKTLYLS